MADVRVGFETVAVVVKGSFNPSIFSPLWLRQQGLIGSPELGEQDIDIITRDFASFRAGWLAVQVATDALQLATTDLEETERLRDVAVGILRTLEHTPIAAVGINREVHFRVDSLERWHEIGDILVPKEHWQDSLKLPGMRSVTIWGARPDEYAGRIQVQVEPSMRIPQAVFVGCNDHFDLVLAPSGPVVTRDQAWNLEAEPLIPSADKIPVGIKVLSEEWMASMKRAEQYVQKVSRLGGPVK